MPGRIRPMRTAQGGLLLCASLFFIAGCARNGPRILARERIAYGDAIAASWKEQMLLNVIRLRYGDTPVFLDPSSIISQSGTLYQGDLSINGSTPISPPKVLVPGAFSTIGGSFLGRNLVEDHATVSYTPLVGERFTRSMLTPLPPKVVLEFVQAGYPIEPVLRTLLFSLNGLANQRGAGLLRREPDPRFVKVVKALTAAQQQGRLYMRLEKRDKGEAVILVLQNLEESPDIVSALHLLGLSAKESELTVVYGNKPAAKNELALLTRSLNDVLFEFAACAEVPESDVEEGRALPAVKLPPELEKVWGPLLRIRSSSLPPQDTFTAVKYRDRWFYIGDTDIMSKRIFSFMMFLITLAESSGPAPAPVVTVPVR